MKPSLTLRRTSTLIVFVLAISVLISMDLDTESITPTVQNYPSENASKELSVQVSSLAKKTDDSARYVLKSYFRAIGDEGWAKIKTVHRSGLMSLQVGGARALTYGKDIYQGTDGYLLEEISANESKLSQVMQDGKVMTLVHNNVYPQSGLEALVFKEYLLPMENLDELGLVRRAEYVGRFFVKGRWMHKLYRGSQMGYDVYEYYNVVSNLKEMVAFGDACVMNLGAYKSINGLKIPTLVEANFKEFERKVTYAIEEVALNVTIPESPIDLKSVSIASLASN